MPNSEAIPNDDAGLESIPPGALRVEEGTKPQELPTVQGQLADAGELDNVMAQTQGGATKKIEESAKADKTLGHLEDDDFDPYAAVA